jgi:Lon protease-like protein
MIERPVLPLFPLPLVVFPDQQVPLHIFEERYKTMIADCHQVGSEGGSLPFVISWQHKDDVEEIGCTLIVQQVLRELPDGRLHILCLGQQRVRIHQVMQDRPYFTAGVSFIDDEDEVVEIDLLHEALQKCLEVLELARIEAGPTAEGIELEGDPNSFMLAHYAGLDLIQRQRLLRATSEQERLEFLVSHFRAAEAELIRRQLARQRGKFNGSIHPN